MVVTSSTQPNAARMEIRTIEPPPFAFPLYTSQGMPYGHEMAIEPTHVPRSRESARQVPNPYEGKWRWWYSAISDWMLRNPGGKLKDCAAEIGRGVSTVGFIASSDTFKTYHSQRKAEYQQGHDELLAAKLHDVASEGLDVLLGTLKKRGDQIPMQTLAPMVTGVLDRLGFGPNTAPTVAVNVNTNNDNRTVVLPPTVSASTLEEARMAMRQVERQKLSSLPSPQTEPLRGGGEVVEVEHADSVLVEPDSAPRDEEVELNAPPDRS